MDLTGVLDNVTQHFISPDRNQAGAVDAQKTDLLGAEESFLTPKRNSLVLAGDFGPDIEVAIVNTNLLSGKVEEV